MKFKIVAVIVFFSFLTACSQNVATTSIPVTATITLTSTAIPFSTITPSPTATQFPPLSGGPPYLVIRHDFDAKELVIYDNDGGGRRIIELSKDRYFTELAQLNKVISPDGKWIAFYIGSVSTGDHLEHLPVTLYLLNITDGEIRKVADVVTDGYEDKQEEVALKLKALDPIRYQPIEGIENWVIGSNSIGFRYGIYSFAWSPNSRYLAFAGQIDGISLDVYLYDIELSTTQRLTDDIQNVVGIRWSPDGTYLILDNSIPGYTYPSSSLHFLKPSEKIIKNPKSLWTSTWEELSIGYHQILMLMTGGGDTGGSADLQGLDVNTGQIRRYWESLYGKVSIDHFNQIIAVTSSDNAPPETFGVYFIDFDGRKRLVLDGFYLNPVFRGGTKHRFLVLKYSLQDGEDLVAIALDGTVDSLGYLENYETSISPDYTWLLIYNEQEADLYDVNDNLVQKFPISDMQGVQWRPDSKGLFYSTGEELYYLSVPYGNVSFVDRCVLKACQFVLDEFYSTWLP